jgi:hypothetical protein
MCLLDIAWWKYLDATPSAIVLVILGVLALVAAKLLRVVALDLGLALAVLACGIMSALGRYSR